MGLISMKREVVLSCPIETEEQREEARRECGGKTEEIALTERPLWRENRGARG